MQNLTNRLVLLSSIVAVASVIVALYLGLVELPAEQARATRLHEELAKARDEMRLCAADLRSAKAENKQLNEQIVRLMWQLPDRIAK